MGALHSGKAKNSEDRLSPCSENVVFPLSAADSSVFYGAQSIVVSEAVPWERAERTGITEAGPADIADNISKVCKANHFQ